MTFQGLPADARLRIYTLAGELVRDLAVEGSGRATWDGTNQNGSPAAGGVYFVFVQGSGTSQTIKIAVQR
jgi:flagellar hook assembly protein FlgD